MALNIDQIPSGVPGLDEVLRGGLVTGRMYLVHGKPGSGKTILGKHFLEEGIEKGETVLYIHGEESRQEILANGAELGIDLTDAEFLDLGPDSDFFTEDQSYDLVEPSDIERSQFTQDINDAIKDIDPARVVIDPITQLRYVEANEYQFRKRLLSFMRFLKDRDVTVIATATLSSGREYDTEIRSLSDGIIELTRGGGGRRLRATKHRACGQMDGDHGMEIRPGGIEVFPAIVPEQHEHSFDPQFLGSGIEELNDQLGGGFERGTVTFISGPTGAGKTTTGTQFLAQAGKEDRQPVIYLFEENVETFTHRSESIGIPVTEMREQGALSVEEVEPLALSAEEFAQMVKRQVEREGADVVMIDGVDGYTMSLQGKEGALVRKLHSLTRYLKNRGVTVLITDEISEITGISTATSTNLSYIADNLMFMSYVEMDGTLRKVVGILKKRTGTFEHTLREFEITSDGIHVGEPLTGISGILQGNPQVDNRGGFRHE